jgi:hypothetical protein
VDVAAFAMDDDDGDDCNPVPLCYTHKCMMTFSSALTVDDIASRHRTSSLAVFRVYLRIDKVERSHHDCNYYSAILARDSLSQLIINSHTATYIRID